MERRDSGRKGLGIVVESPNPADVDVPVVGVVRGGRGGGGAKRGGGGNPNPPPGYRDVMEATVAVLVTMMDVGVDAPG